ncbi:MAG: hypothetical protein KKF46_05265 [Nanoarchaeota archaeon]|nr:hypothetical protein [Nanoarchaeota archaeon]MBU1321743.1 hypothetical protein [Nanoarchaeota archaeon]MBU1597467.1 hypothetical protein [Nanoarchaeota archaeon]MBU2441405.1 hypothetical protein [Nanoarchaeota archaeon]
MKYKINEITPEPMRCAAVACPAIYQGVRETTPEEMRCAAAACPSAYEATIGGKDVYLIVGKVINVSEVGFGELEKKIGEGETLIEVPRALIDDREK